MSNVKTIGFRIFLGITLAASLSVFCLTGCGGGGGGGSSSSSTTPPPVTPPPVVTNSITAFADGGGGTSTIVTTSVTPPSAGAVIVISGTTNYNGTYTVVSATATTFTIAAAFVAETPTTAVWQSGGGVIAGCSTTGATGAITLAGAPSRFTGVAPLAVFFDATATTATATTKPFHELEYRWSFGDTGVGAGTWGNGSRAGSSSRNTATGAVAAHVFETPGTYTINLTATDGTNTVSNSCVQIAVQDPNVVFAGTNTTCIGATATPAAGSDGCPAGSAVVQQPDFVAIINTYALTGKRVLLKHGDTFNEATSPNLAVTGPGVIGMYGSGAKPIINPTAASVAEGLLFSGSGTPTMSDWRIMDLEFVEGAATPHNALHSNGGVNQLTLLRIDTSGLDNRSFLFDDHILNFWNSNGSPGHTLYDQLFIVDSTTFGSFSAYLTAQRFAVMGNSLNNNGVCEHTLRVQFGYKGVVSNNTLQGQCPTKHAFTLRAEIFGSGTAGVNANNFLTQYIEVSDNKFVGDAADQWTVFYGPQGNEDDRLTDVVTERNWFISGTGTQFAAVLNASNHTIRNNVFDISLGASHNGLNVNSNPSFPSTTWTTNAWVYNNTFFDSAASLTAVIVSTDTTGAVVKNNLAYAPSGGTMLSDSGTGTAQSNNSATLSTSPLFTSVSPFNPTNAKPTAGSYAIGGGTPVPVWSDFFLVAEPATRDLGAVVH